MAPRRATSLSFLAPWIRIATSARFFVPVLVASAALGLRIVGEFRQVRLSVELRDPNEQAATSSATIRIDTKGLRLDLIVPKEDGEQGIVFDESFLFGSVNIKFNRIGVWRAHAWHFYLGAPVVIPVIVLLAVGLLLSTKRFRGELRLLRGRCYECGYLLYGTTSGKCPECGHQEPTVTASP